MPAGKMVTLNMATFIPAPRANIDVFQDKTTESAVTKTPCISTGLAFTIGREVVRRGRGGKEREERGGGVELYPLYDMIYLPSSLTRCGCC